MTNRGLTTDAVSGFLTSTGGDQAEQLVGYVGGEECRYLCRIVSRVDLHYVTPDYVHACESPYEILSLTACEASHLWCPRARRKGRIDKVHIEGDVGLRITYPLTNPRNGLRYTLLSDLVRADKLKAQLPGIVPVTGVEERATHPDLDRILRPQEHLLDGASEGRPVRVLLAEVGVPGVRVTVELHEGQRSVRSRRCSQLRQGDRVVAAEHYRDDACAVYGLESFRYPPVALLDVAGDDGDVAVVYNREEVEDRDILRRVVWPEQVRDAADALRAEARPDAEGRRRIKGNSDNRSVAIVEVSDVWQSHESAHPAETRCLERVGRFVAPHIHLPYYAGNAVASHHQPALIGSSAPGSTKIVQGMRASGARACRCGGSRIG